MTYVSSPCRATALSAVPLRVTNDLKMELLVLPLFYSGPQIKHDIVDSALPYQIVLSAARRLVLPYL